MCQSGAGAGQAVRTKWGVGFPCPLLGRYGQCWGLSPGKGAAASRKNDRVVLTRGKGRVSEAPDLSLLVTSTSDQASYGSTNIPTEFRPLLGPEATRPGHPRGQTVG